MHNILGERFFHRSDRPAWHGLGIHIGGDVQLSASEALERIGGGFAVVKQPLLVQTPGGSISTGYYALMREPIPEDRRWRMMGAPVSGDYVAIDPALAASLWDASVSQGGNPAPVETLGILGKGERMFISTALPVLHVRGDEVITHLVYDNPLESGRALGVYVTATRVVCQNTLNAAVANAVQRRRVAHTPGALEQLGRWLRTIYSDALRVRQEMQQAFDVLASRPASDADVRWIAETIYHDPPRPVADEERARRAPLEARQRAWEVDCERLRQAREMVLTLFQGAGTGMTAPSCRGTLFGAYNAVAELETYRRSWARTAFDVIAGERGDRIRQAFALCMQRA